MSSHHTDKPHCLVLGGNGFIGSHLVNTPVAQGWPVRSLNRCAREHGDPEAVENVVGEFTDQAAVKGALTGCKRGFSSRLNNFAEVIKRQLDPRWAREFLSTLVLLDAAHNEGAKKKLFVSSGRHGVRCS